MEVCLYIHDAYAVVYRSRREICGCDIRGNGDAILIVILHTWLDGICNRTWWECKGAKMDVLISMFASNGYLHLAVLDTAIDRIIIGMNGMSGLAMTQHLPTESECMTQLTTSLLFVERHIRS